MNKFSERLAAAREAKGLNQSQLAKLLGVTPQAVQSWESGKAVPRSYRLAAAANILGVDYYALSGMAPPEHFKTAARFAENVANNWGNIQALSSEEAQYGGNVAEWDDNTPLADDDIAIPFLKEVELAAGSGRTAVERSSNSRLRFGKYSLKKEGVQADHAVAVTVRGNSMEPVLPDGATVAVNTADTRVTDGKTYAISHAGQLRVKLLYRLPGGGLRIRSYNRDEHPDEEYSLAQVEEQEITVIGRVFWGAMYF